MFNVLAKAKAGKRWIETDAAQHPITLDRGSQPASARMIRKG
jgi:hypothetical protein